MSVKGQDDEREWTLVCENYTWRARATKGVAAGLIALRYGATYVEALERLNGRIDFIFRSIPGASRTVTLPEAEPDGSER